VPAEAARAREEAFGEKARHEFHLSTNYRNSKEIYDFAAAYAARAGLDADLPDAVRSTGVAPQERLVTAAGGNRHPDLEAAVREAVVELAEDLEGTVGIVVPSARRTSVQAWLDSWDELGEHRAGGPDARIVVLTGLDTKGLEFDGIVVVERAEIEAESPTGRATLYVVLTRATQRMVTVSAG
jgi:DNA helicase IV